MDTPDTILHQLTTTATDAIRHEIAADIANHRHLDAIRTARSAGWSAQQIADHLGASRSWIYRVLDGDGDPENTGKDSPSASVRSTPSES